MNQMQKEFILAMHAIQYLDFNERIYCLKVNKYNYT